MLPERLRITQNLATNITNFLRSSQMQILDVLPQIRLVHKALATFSALKITQVSMLGGDVKFQRRPVGQRGAAQVARDFGV